MLTYSLEVVLGVSRESVDPARSVNLPDLDDARVFRLNTNTLLAIWRECRYGDTRTSIVALVHGQELLRDEILRRMSNGTAGLISGGGMAVHIEKLQLSIAPALTNRRPSAAQVKPRHPGARRRQGVELD